MLVETLIILAKIAVVIFGFVMAAGGLMTLVERKQSALIQNRVGPNRANLFGHVRGEKLAQALRLGGIFHLMADGIKMLFKEDIVPDRAHKVLYTLAPMLMLLPALVVFAVIPWSDHWCVDGAIVVAGGRDVCMSEARSYFTIADLDVGFLFIFAIASLNVYGVAVAGWSSNNKFALLGGLRASAQMVSYEVPMGLSIIGVLMIFGTLNLNELVQAQGELLFGVLPKWGIIVQPVAFLLFLTASIAETKRAPFDVPEGESEIAHGYVIEYTGLKFGMMMLSEFIGVVFVAAMASVLFLGGWQVPYLYGDGVHMPYPWMYALFAAGFVLLAAWLGWVGYSRKQRVPLVAAALVGVHAIAFVVMASTQRDGFQALPYPFVVLARVGAMMLKITLLAWLQLMLRWTLPRFRYDQIMHLGWKVLIPVALLNLLVTAILFLPLAS